MFLWFLVGGTDEGNSGVAGIVAVTGLVCPNVRSFAPEPALELNSGANGIFFTHLFLNTGHWIPVEHESSFLLR